MCDLCMPLFSYFPNRTNNNNSSQGCSIKWVDPYELLKKYCSMQLALISESYFFLFYLILIYSLESLPQGNLPWFLEAGIGQHYYTLSVYSSGFFLGLCFKTKAVSFIFNSQAPKIEYVVCKVFNVCWMSILINGDFGDMCCCVGIFINEIMVST